MTLPSPLSVHVEHLGVRRQITPSDLSFTRSARGGYESATLTFPEWVTREDAGVGTEAKVMVDDARNARRVFEGYMGIPGKTVTRDQGHVWQAGVAGAKVVLTDTQLPYTAIVSDSYDMWQQSNASVAAMTAAAGVVPGSDAPCLLLTVPRGIAVANNDKVAAQLAVFDLGAFDQTSLLGVGGVSYTVDSGVVDTDWRTQLVMDGAVSNEIARFNNFDTSAVSAVRQVSTHWTLGQNQARIRVFKNAGGAANVADDVHWTTITGLRVTALLYDQAGSPITTAGFYTPEYVLAHQVAVDAVYKLSNWIGTQYASIDLANATVDTTFTRQIKQFTYPQPVRLTDLFDDLCRFEPDLTYGVFESNAANRHRFEVGRYGSAVRYEADSLDGLTVTGGDSGLANIIAANYTDPSVGPQITFTVPTTTAAGVPGLFQWNRLRWGEPLDFGNEAGVTDGSSAILAARAYLDQLIADDALAGTLTCVRPIRDLVNGCAVMPWEIEPGNNIVVRDVSDTPVRITDMTYTASSQSAALTLGNPVLTADQLLNQVVKRRNRFHGIRQTPIET